MFCRFLLSTITLALLSTAILAEAPLTVSKPEEVGFSSERLQRIHTLIERYQKEGRVSGAVTLVARKGKVIHYEAHGLKNLEARTPMTKDTLFRMASCTKPVTAVAILMLMEEGKLRLTDPVSQFIPEFKDTKVAVQKDDKVELVAASRPITIQDLLTHTSGLGSGGLGQRQVPGKDTFPNGNDTLNDYALRLAKMPLDFQPGTLWRYSGLAGIDVLARIVEVASGMPFDVYLQKNLFEPLGMKDTCFLVPDDKQSRLATIYQRSPKGLEVREGFTFLATKTYSSGAGGLTSTAEDWWRFAQMLGNGGELNGKRLLSPRTVELMASNHVGSLFTNVINRKEGMGFGLTVEVVMDNVKAQTRRSNGSFGWDGAFGTHFWVDPKEKVVAVLLIQTHTMHRDFENAVMQAMVE
jgi:CubicO group peptidase (beta-lactamase class C family)